MRTDVPEVIAVTGHKSQAGFDRNDITSGRDLREAVGRLAEFHQSHPVRTVISAPQV